MLTNNSSTNSVTYLPPVIHSWVFLAGLLSLVGTLTNLLVLIPILQFPQLRRGTGVFIAHLLIFQLIFCAIVMPVNVFLVSSASGKFTNTSGTATCRTQHTFHVGLSVVFSWLDALLAVNRLVAVFFPLYFRIFSYKSVQWLALVFCWLNALIIAVPPSFEYLAVYRMSPIGLCSLVVRSETMRILSLYTTYCPLFFTALAAVAVPSKWFLNQARTRVNLVVPVDVSITTVQKVQLRRRQQTSRMLVASFILCVVCQLPNFIMASSYSSLYAVYPLIGLFLRLLYILQIAAVLVVYLVLNNDYQRKARALYGQLACS